MRGLGLALSGVALLSSVSLEARTVKPHAAKAPAAPVTAEAFLAAHARLRGVLHTASGLQYRIVTPAPAGPHPGDTDVALINYVGKLTNGKVFDQSAQPTPLPVSGVVPGFSEARKLLSKGAKYRVWIPPGLGYGNRDAGPIPPGSVLVFDIELVDFMSEQDYQQLRAQQGAAAPQ